MMRFNVGDYVQVRMRNGRSLAAKVVKAPDALEQYQDYEVEISSLSLEMPGPPRLVGLLTTLIDGVMRERTFAGRKPVRHG